MKKILLTCLMLGGFMLIMAQPKIEFDKKTHDFGEVHEEGGKITARFTFRNTGDSALVLTKVKPGCGCTAANYTHDPVAPGEYGFIDATYDPWGRPGAFNKNIKVNTNITGETQPILIFIKGTVLKRPPTKYEIAGYRNGRGELRVKEPTVRTTVYNTESRKDTFFLHNFFEDRAVTITPELPPYIQEVDRSFGQSLGPNQEGYIVLKYDAMARNSWGQMKDRAVLITDDTLEPRKYLYFNMKIEEDFTHMTPAQKANAPRLAVNKQVFNFDTIAQNTSASDVIEITNQGRSPLIIRKIESQMPALTYSISTSTIEPGQKATLQITFKAQNRRHRQQCTLDIISNSPTNPIQTIKVEGFIMPK